MKPLTENRIPSPTNIRKITKPLIEKKRRARINSSLAELKTLLEVTLGQQISRDSKMEKADILELAVRHLRQVRQVNQVNQVGQVNQVSQGQMKAAPTLDSSVINKYRSGYTECAQEIQRYLGAASRVNQELKNRLLTHLNNNMHTRSAESVYQRNYNRDQSLIDHRLSPTEMNHHHEWMTSSAHYNSMTSPPDMTSSNITSPHSMTSQQPLDLSRLQQPLYVSVKDEDTPTIQVQPIRTDKNSNYFTVVSQPIRESLLMKVATIRPMITALSRQRINANLTSSSKSAQFCCLKPEITMKQELSPKPWRPW